MLDPHKMPDHPVNVLIRSAADAYAGDHPEYGDQYSTAATRLAATEAETDVVYLVADREALRAVKEAYDRYAENPFHYHCGEVITAVRDLLGLDDS